MPRRRPSSCTNCLKLTSGSAQRSLLTSLTQAKRHKPRKPWESTLYINPKTYYIFISLLYYCISWKARITHRRRCSAAVLSRSVIVAWLLSRILNSTTPNICVAMLNYLNTTYLHILSKKQIEPLLFLRGRNDLNARCESHAHKF